MDALPTPAAAGTWQNKWVTGLQPNTWYYLAIRARDEMHNWGPISVVHSRTAQSGGGGGGESAQDSGTRVEAGSGAPRDGTTAHGAAPAGPPLALEVRVAGGVPELSVHRASLDAAANGIAIEAPDGSGGWVRRGVAADPGIGALTVRQRRDGAHRYVLPGSYAVARIAASVATGTGAGLELSAAENSRTGALEPATDLQSPAMESGDTLRVSYALTEAPSARAEDWLVLLTRGAAVSANNSGQSSAAAPPPLAFALHQSQPNPFSHDVSIAFDLPRESAVKVEVHDLQGRLVAKLADGVHPAGRHSVKWDRSGRRGDPAPPGVYLYSMAAGSFRAQRKMVALP